MTITEVDEHLGLRVQQARNHPNLSKAALAQSLKISEGQLSEYESGYSHVSASRLYEISYALNVPGAWLFEGYLPKS